MPTPDPSSPAFHLGDIPIAHATALAPMAALTDTVFRRLVKRQGGCGFLISEMVASEALLRGCAKARDLLRFAEEERPIGGQIMGSRPERMAEAARVVESLGFDFVDVNMGCPARKIVAEGGGSALLRDLHLIEQILTAIRKAVRIPLTIKIRAGWDNECLNAPDVARVGEAAGAALVSVHARTKTDAYRPVLREEVLGLTRAAVRIPVVANGDIRSIDGARLVLARTGCAAVMAGRGAVANPWLLGEITTGVASEPSAERARQWILGHFGILREELQGPRLMTKLKTFAGWYTRGLLSGARLRERIQTLSSAEEFREAVEEFFDAYPEMAPRGALHRGVRPSVAAPGEAA